MSILTKPIFIFLLLVLFAGAGLVGGPSNGLDADIMERMAQVRTDWPSLVPLVTGITSLGGAYVTVPLATAASLWLLVRRMPARALLLALTVVIERSLVEWLKDWVGRPRPHFGVESLPSSLAFPSGHAANSMTAFLLTALVLAPPAHRKPWAVGALILSVVVGLSRIYLGVHWPSDVIGGWALGLLGVSIALAIGQRSGAIEAKHQIVGRHRPALGEDEAK